MKFATLFSLAVMPLGLLASEIPAPATEVMVFRNSTALIRYQALPKGDKLDTVIQKAVECGACEVIPFESSRCIVRAKPEAEARKTERRCRIAEEAAKQCGRGMIPTVRPNRMLIFGDSITQGYDAIYPSHSYANVLADHLNADARNKGIGGDMFCPGLIDEDEQNDPNYITVAYGTNDWYFKTPEVLEADAREFYSKLTKVYPNAKIFAITPIWRISERENRPGGDFTRVSSVLKRAAEGLANVTVIDGYNLVPHDPKLYLDGGLHPAESGFAYYAERLFAKIKESL